MQKRHKIDISKLGSEVFLLSRVERSLSKVDCNPDMKLSTLIGKVKSLFLLSVLENQELEKLRKYTGLQITFSLINWQRNFQAVEFSYKGEVYKLNKLQQISTNTNTDIFKLLSLSIINNDKEKINQLLDLKLSTKENPYSLSRLSFLRALLTEERELADMEYSKIQEYSQNGTTVYHSLEGDKIINSKDTAVFYQTLSTPILHLYKLAYAKDSTSFNKELEKYAINKRTYLGKFKKLHEWEHWVDFDAIAVSAYAQRRGVDINFQSEYFPMWIVQG